MRKFSEDSINLDPSEALCSGVNDSTHQKSKLGPSILNALAFQGAWFDLLVFNTGAAWFFIAVLLVQVGYVYKGQLASLFLPLSAVLLSGLLLDSVLSIFGIFTFPESVLLGSIMPLWLVALWLGFILTLPISFAWILDKPRVSVGVFACMAPLSYMAGRHLGVIDFSNASVLAIGLVWGLIAYLSCQLIGSELARLRVLNDVSPE